MRIQIVVLALCVGCGSGGDDAEPGAAMGGAGGANAVAGGQSTGTSGMSGGAGAAGTSAGGHVGQAGQSGEGGSGAEGGGGALDPGDISKTEACLKYTAAREARRLECNGQPVPDVEGFERGIEGCPDRFFSEGSTRTIAGLLDCAEQARSFPCDQTRWGRVPPCVTPGTRGAGESCVFQTQCASLRCSGSDSMCGLCAAPAAAGESCNDIDSVCPPNYRCDGVCVEITGALPITPPEPPPQTKPTGAACASHEECTAPDLCFDEANDGVQLCRPRVSLGGFCGAPTTYCFDEHYCDSNDDTCKVMPGNGEPCGLHWGEPSYCAKHLACALDDPAGATCRPLPGYECDFAGLTCGPGTTCCASPDCGPPTCVLSLRPGDACGDPNARCIHGSTCEAGICTVDDRVTVFAELCGMP